MILRKLPEYLREKEVLWRRLILFSLLIGGVVLYFPEILQILAALLWICLPFIIGGIISFVLNTITNVIIRFCQRLIKFTITPRIKIYFKILTVFLMLIISIFTFASIVPQLLQSVERLITNVPIVINDIYAYTLSWAGQYPVLSDWLLSHEVDILNVSSIVSSLVDFVTTGGFGETIQQIGGALSGTFAWLWIVFISIMFSFIAFFNTNRIVKETRMVAMAYLQVKHYRIFAYIAKKTSRVFSQYLGGTLLECIILGALVSIINMVLNIPYPLLIGVVCGIAALVPMFGATLAAFVCAFFLAIINPVKGLTFLVAFLILQQIEGNFIYPNVVGKSVGLPSIYVLMAITIGASIAGILGIILSIPITTVLYELLKEDAVHRILKKDYSPMIKEEYLEELPFHKNERQES